MTTYRVFIGGWCDACEPPDWTSFDVGGLIWPQARQTLIEHLLPITRDGLCEHCKADAVASIDRLLIAPEGLFECDVEGDDYMIIPEINSPSETP